MLVSTIACGNPCERSESDWRRAKPPDWVRTEIERVSRVKLCLLEYVPVAWLMCMFTLSRVFYFQCRRSCWFNMQFHSKIATFIWALPTPPPNHPITIVCLGIVRSLPKFITKMRFRYNAFLCFRFSYVFFGDTSPSQYHLCFRLNWEYVCCWPPHHIFAIWKATSFALKSPPIKGIPCRCLWDRTNAMTWYLVWSAILFNVSC